MKRMWLLCLLAAGAVLAALPLSAALAINNNPDSVGEARLVGAAGVSGSAVVRRRLTSNETHVMLRLSGLRPSSMVTYELLTKSQCGVTTGLPVITATAPINLNTAGGAMSVTTHSATLPVGGAPWVAIRVYETTTRGVRGAELACGNFYRSPDQGSIHWW